MSDAQERTEQATQKHLKEAREKGRIAKSHDLTAWIGVGAAAVLLPSTVDAASSAGTAQFFAVRQVIEHPEPARALAALGDAFGSLLATLGPMLGAVFVAVIVAAVAQGGIHLKRFSGHYEQFNVLAGVRRMLGMQAAWEGAKTLLKSGAVALGLYLVVQGLMPLLMQPGSLSVSAIIGAGAGGVVSLMQAAIGVGLVLAAIDVLVIMRRNRKHTRMTKREVKDENKNTDGDPLIKSQRRSRQLAMSRNRMIAAIADADVVVVNPTHVAVALKYEPGKSAPRVVAKGAGQIAAKIRERAEVEGVPMVQDIPLARALHAACELGAEIPVELYNAVARVLAFVMNLRARGAAHGIHTIAEARPARPAAVVPSSLTGAHR